MAIVFLSGNKITGTSGDVKPTLVATNSTLLETDTNVTFQYNGSAWVQLDVGVGDTISNTELEGNISLSKLANGTAGKLVGYNASTGVIEEQDAPVAGAQSHKFTASGTLTPNTQTGTVKIFTKTDGMSAGNITIQVDGADTVISSGSADTNTFVSPTSSLSVKASSVGWQNVGGAPPRSFGISASGVKGLTLSGDGMKLYKMVGTTISQYNMTASLDLSTATLGNSFNLGGNATGGIKIRPDGTSLYYYNQANNRIYQRDFGTAYDVTTLGSEVGYGSNGNSGTFNHFDIASDGIHIYCMGNHSGYPKIGYGTMSTPWDITTAYIGNYKTISSPAQGSSGTGFAVSNDGGTFWYNSPSNNRVYRWSMGTQWNAFTATDNSNFDSYFTYGGAGNETNVLTLCTSEDGTVTYIAGSIKNQITEYQTNTAFAGTGYVSIV